MLSIDVVIPDFQFLAKNAGEVVVALAQWERDQVIRRTEAGEGASGPLPAPKDGGRPFIRSGQLLASIQAKFFGARSGGLPYAQILPTADRSDAQERQTSRRRRLARARGTATRNLRAAGRSESEIRAHVKTIRSSSRLRGRNMDVAAILANPPKDKRARAGNRGIYDVFRASAGEQESLRRLAAELLVVALVERDTGAEYPGQGEVG